jgi:hypothetical protein
MARTKPATFEGTLPEPRPRTIGRILRAAIKVGR